MFGYSDLYLLTLRIIVILITLLHRTNSSDLAIAQSSYFEEKSKELEMDRTIIENSPVIQQWLKTIPNVLQKIQQEPIFKGRIRWGYSEFPSASHNGGIFLGVEDLFIGQTPLTFNADYYTDFDGDRLSIGADLHYYALPLGNYINLAPVIGYRYVQTDGYHTDGVNLGLRLGLILSPQGAGDIFLTQSFVSPTGSQEVGITEIRAGYAITENMRISAGVEWQNSRKRADSQVSIGLEWIINNN